jgi:FOP N terminal dimerisation domain
MVCCMQGGPVNCCWEPARPSLCPPCIPLRAPAAVKDSLDRRGLLRHLQANVRAHVYKVLLEAEVCRWKQVGCASFCCTSTPLRLHRQGGAWETPTTHQHTPPATVLSLLLHSPWWTRTQQDAPRPQPSDENLLINELIREYLIYNGYRDTLSVFIPETGQPQQRPFDRTFLSQQLRISETPSTQQV